RSISTWDGVWWAVSTMTTVGYGDLYPHTDLGRAIAIVVMTVGIGFGSLLVAALAERFVHSQVEEETAEIEAGMELAEQELLGELVAIQQRLQRIELALRART
ncbi:MAG TPA: potassium channel family protein, partial [Gaiellaceae bacterium]